ncbi:MAG TPA: hypothetical protein VGF30_07885 [Bacteroidia bacterium]
MKLIRIITVGLTCMMLSGCSYIMHFFINNNTDQEYQLTINKSGGSFSDTLHLFSGDLITKKNKVRYINKLNKEILLTKGTHSIPIPPQSTSLIAIGMNGHFFDLGFIVLKNKNGANDTLYAGRGFNRNLHFKGTTCVTYEIKD